MHAKGHFTIEGQPVDFDVMIDRPVSDRSEVVGSITQAGSKGQVIVMGGQSAWDDASASVRGRSLVQIIAGDNAAALVGDGWFRLDTDIGPAIKALKFLIAPDRFGDPSAFLFPLTLNRDTFAHVLSAGLAKVGRQTVHGVSAVTLKSAAGSLSVAAGGIPYPLAVTLHHIKVRLVRFGLARFEIDNLTMTFDDYGKPVGIPRPPKVIAASDPRTFPPHFVAAAINYSGPCPTEGCKIAVTVRNDGGEGSTTATIRIYAVTHKGSVTRLEYIGHGCPVVIPNTAPNRTATISALVSCASSVAELSSYAKSHPGAITRGCIDIENPRKDPVFPPSPPPHCLH